MAHLHITYQHRDRDVAKTYARELQRRHRVSIDVDYLIPGEEWRLRLKEAVLNADGLVVLLSDNSVTPDSDVISSQWVAADIGAARASGKFVIPVILKKGVRFPALIDDIYTLFPVRDDELEVAQAVAAINDAVEIHMERAEKTRALFLPGGYEALAPNVRSFREDTPYDQAVLVMMKFADPNSMDDVQCQLLADIWETIRTVVAAHGLKAKRADKKAYHEQLWENVCVYMLGSKYGLAVLEDRVASELNPNVALEYGFMRALNRKVGLLRDVHFKHDRADLTGKLAQPFNIDAAGELDEESLQQAVRGWLIDVGVPPLERL